MSTDPEDQMEIERLRERVAALEAQLLETEAWAFGLVAEAQEKTYWLDRWQLDLNKLLHRRSAERIRAVARAVRWFHRKWRVAKWRLLK